MSEFISLGRHMHCQQAGIVADVLDAPPSDVYKATR